MVDIFFVGAKIGGISLMCAKNKGKRMVNFGNISQKYHQFP